MLLETYEDQNITGWLMSEKLDGVRAFWDGEKLYSRGGYAFSAPDWFIKDFPPFALDGELWSKGGEFEKIQSITSKMSPHEGWQDLGFYVFDVPDEKGGLLARLEALTIFLKTTKALYLHIIEQIECKNVDDALAFKDSIIKKGGEGIVLRNPNSAYEGVRTNNALKFKDFQDAECTVVAHHEGEGKYKNMLGSFTCKDKDGLTFRIGSGLSDEKRKNPPSIGEIVTYKHYGRTTNNLPRFPIFLHIRSVP